MKSLLARWFPVGAWMALIFLLSAQPQLPGPPIPVLPIAAHFVEYAVLAWLLLRAVYQSGKAEMTQAMLWSLAIVVFYAASDELHQVFVPGRTADLWDIAWDLAGAGVAVLAWLWVKK